MSITFDPTKSFDQNLETFLHELNGRDPAMTQILRTHIQHLKGKSDDSKRRAARTTFNANVKGDLEKIVMPKNAGK